MSAAPASGGRASALARHPLRAPPPLPPATVLLKADFTIGEVKFDKVQVSSKDEIAVEFSNTTLVKGAKLTFKGKDASRAAGSNGVDATVGAEYKAGNLFATADLSVVSLAALPLDASALFSYDGFLVGATAKVDLRKVAEPTDYNVLVGYKAKGVAFTAVTDNKLSGVTAGLLMDVSKDVTVGAVASFKTMEKGPFALEAGLSYKSSADQTLHAKVNKSGRVGVSFAHTLSAMSKITTSASIDAANLGAESHKVGMLLNLTF